MQNAALRPFAIVACSIAILCCSVVARAQSVDATFDPGANQTVNTIAVQPDGKTVVGGNFTGLGGVSGVTTRNRIGRLNVDGTVDTGFNPGANAPLLAVAVQPDGKILAGGNFTSVGGGTGLTSSRSRIARFNADGTIDAGFNPGASGNVWALALQPDGKILVGGEFARLGGGGSGVTTRIGIGRLNADGTIDTAFDPGATKLPAGAVPIIYTIALQADGKILVGGYFNGLGGVVRNYIGRLNADGTIDAGFDPGANSISGVNALALQADGKILVGGTFTGLGLGTGTTLRQNIGRLNVDGTVDAGFNPGAESQVLTLGVQTDGRILAGGYFKWLGGQGGPTKSDRFYIGRFNVNGTVDTSFNPGAGNVVNAVGVQGDGAIVAGGIFLTVGGGTGLATPRNRIARFANTDAGIQSLTLSSTDTVVTWARSGGGPEVSRMTFEVSVGGAIYTPLGNGTRVANGWTLSGLSLPDTRVYIRARGYYETGQNGSGSIVESILSPGPATAGDYDGDGKADLAVYRPSSSTWYTLNSLASTVSAVPFGLSGDVPVPGDYDGDGKTDIAVYRPSSSFWVIQQSTAGFMSLQWGLSGDVPVPADYDGDGKTDLAVFRPSNATWYILNSLASTVSTVPFGLNGDVPVPADYGGDGKADLAVFRPSNGTWYVLDSLASTVSTNPFGINGDVPVPGDYDGDGKTDIAVYRPSTSTWFIGRSAAGFIYLQWGLSGDVPVPADYDGDGKADIAVFRPSSATWYVLNSFASAVSAVPFGLSGDVPVPADYGGDGKADIAVFRPSSGTWYVLDSLASTLSTVPFGLNGDVPVPGDYDGDGKTDIAVYRPNSSTWYIGQSTAGFTSQQWGVTGDVPVPGDYDGDGKTDVAVYRPSTSTWLILQSTAGFTSQPWGLPGDVPVPGDYDGDGKTDIAVYRPNSSTWYIQQSTAGFTSRQWGISGDVPVPADYDGDGKADLAVFRPSSSAWYIPHSATNHTTSDQFQWGLSGDITVPGDYDGDGRTDPAVYRPSNGAWYMRKSTTGFGTPVITQFGLPGDIALPNTFSTTGLKKVRGQLISD